MEPEMSPARKYFENAAKKPRANASKKIFEDLGRYSLLIM
jgi:hypothetical protein